MKKIKMSIVILVSLSLLIMGCSNTQAPDDINNVDGIAKELEGDNLKKEDEDVSIQADLNNEANSDSNIEDIYESIFGKVKNRIGNEIELEMGLLPDWNEGGDIKPGEKKKTGISQEMVTIKETPPGQEDYIAPDPDSSIFGDNGEISLTYTGESRSIIIPAGVDIRNILGQNATIDEIKKGSILLIKQKSIADNGFTIDMLTILK